MWNLISCVVKFTKGYFVVKNCFEMCLLKLSGIQNSLKHLSILGGSSECLPYSIQWDHWWILESLYRKVNWDWRGSEANGRYGQ